jgi:hypothetical protein
VITAINKLANFGSSVSLDFKEKFWDLIKISA